MNANKKFTRWYVSDKTSFYLRGWSETDSGTFLPARDADRGSEWKCLQCFFSSTQRETLQLKQTWIEQLRISPEHYHPLAVFVVFADCGELKKCGKWNGKNVLRVSGVHSTMSFIGWKGFCCCAQAKHCAEVIIKTWGSIAQFGEK